MISWLNAMLETCQDKLALTKAWLDTEMPVKNRVVVAVAVVNAIVVIGLDLPSCITSSVAEEIEHSHASHNTFGRFFIGHLS